MTRYEIARGLKPLFGKSYVEKFERDLPTKGKPFLMSTELFYSLVKNYDFYNVLKRYNLVFDKGLSGMVIIKLK